MHKYRNPKQLCRVPDFFTSKANVANGTDIFPFLSVLSGLSHLVLHIFVMVQPRAAKGGVDSIV